MALAPRGQEHLLRVDQEEQLLKGLALSVMHGGPGRGYGRGWIFLHKLVLSNLATNTCSICLVFGGTQARLLIVSGNVLMTASAVQFQLCC